MLDDIREITELMEQVMEEARLDIIRRHEAEGQVASGRTRRSIKAETEAGVSQVTSTLYGREFFGALETGSKPWAKKRRHPPRAFVETIEQWMEYKGLTDMSAYLVARKIMNEGTRLYREGGNDIIFTPAIKAVMERIDGEINGIIDRTITSILREENE